MKSYESLCRYKGVQFDYTKCILWHLKIYTLSKVIPSAYITVNRPLFSYFHHLCMNSSYCCHNYICNNDTKAYFKFYLIIVHSFSPSYDWSSTIYSYYQFTIFVVLIFQFLCKQTILVQWSHSLQFSLSHALFSFSFLTSLDCISSLRKRKACVNCSSHLLFSLLS